MRHAVCDYVDQLCRPVIKDRKRGLLRSFDRRRVRAGSGERPASAAASSSDAIFTRERTLVPCRRSRSSTVPARHTVTDVPACWRRTT
ncbi:hypothetical protein F2P81_021905 [Scophthalmus maximus]|uniref:Uncharacterized protein n=1 Tax=Scophthalmus maximus TaxID=52904 RepID=A0A6A4S3B9_SCOMX|nr:hypothetical protein F2P81_021905 [Scophthalmus maximus]